MTLDSAGDAAQSIAIDEISVSDTDSQKQRRAHFKKDAIAELADSIKTMGLLSPIIVRPIYKDSDALRADGYQLVAGERRLLAAKQAGLESISANVRKLSDEQVIEIQLVENLQREGLHELMEAEGYEGLQKLGYSAEEIAAKVGKSKAYVYGRMKLLALGPASREAFYRGELNASTALLLARIPVATVQREATGKITKGRYDGEPLSFREARDLIEREYMLRLADASFPTNDAELLPKAGTCSACPKRTGNQKELFDDIKSGDVCTDPVCFKAKREAWAKTQIAKAKETGQTIITGAQANKIAQYGQVSGGFARLDDRCNEDSKYRTYRQLLGKKTEVEVSLLQMPKTGELVQVVDRSSANRQLKKDGVIPKREATSRAGNGTGVSAGSKRKAELDIKYRRRLLATILAKAPALLDRHHMEAIANRFYEEGYGEDAPLFELFGWEIKAKSGMLDYKAFAAKLKTCSAQELVRVVIGYLFMEQISEYGDAKALDAEGERFGIDTAKLRAEVKTEVPTAAKPKVKSKTKAKKS